MRKIEYSQGQVFGKWRVLDRDYTRKKRAYWICECISCGTKQAVSGLVLRKIDLVGGCKRCRSIGDKGLHPLEYAVWQNIKTRCFNKNRPSSDTYNKLGMYSGWVDDFQAFLKHIGPRPSIMHSVDRINNTLGYVPGNVRWATKREQANNTKRNLYVYGIPLMSFADMAKIPYNTVKDRYYRGEYTRPIIDYI